MRKNIVLGIFVLYSLFNIASALSNSGGGNWAYNKEIIIQENSGKTLNDYQILVKLDGSNFDFSKAKPDGSDIRFTLNDMELPYWVEEWNKETNKAKIWVKVPSISANGNMELISHYGNPSASAISNGDATFEFFDDFIGDNLDAKWSTVEGDWQVDNGILTHKGTGIVNVPTPDIIFSNYHSRDGIAIHSKIKWIDNGYFEDGIIWNYDPKKVNYYIALLSDYDYSIGARIDEAENNDYKDTEKKYEPFNDIERDKWYDYTVGLYDSYFEFYVDGSKIISWKPTSMLDYGNIGLGCWKGQYLQEVEYDHIFITKYASIEPTVTISSDSGIVPKIQPTSDLNLVHLEKPAIGQSTAYCELIYNPTVSVYKGYLLYLGPPSLKISAPSGYKLGYFTIVDTNQLDPNFKYIIWGGTTIIDAYTVPITGFLATVYDVNKESRNSPKYNVVSVEIEPDISEKSLNYVPSDYVPFTQPDNIYTTKGTATSNTKYVYLIQLISDTPKSTWNVDYDCKVNYLYTQDPSYKGTALPSPPSMSGAFEKSGSLTLDATTFS